MKKEFGIVISGITVSIFLIFLIFYFEILDSNKEEFFEIKIENLEDKYFSNQPIRFKAKLVGFGSCGGIPTAKITKGVQIIESWSLDILCDPQKKMDDVNFDMSVIPGKIWNFTLVEPGTYMATVEFSKYGYGNVTAQKSFEIIDYP